MRFFYKDGIISIFLPTNPGTEKPMYPTKIFAFTMAVESTAAVQEIPPYAVVLPGLIANRYLCSTKG